MPTYTKDHNALPVYSSDPANNNSRGVNGNIKNVSDQTQEYFLRGNTTSPINEHANINMNEYDSKVVKQKKTLNAYIYDFLLKSNHNDTAISFYNEADIVEDGNRPIRMNPDVHVPPAFIPKFNTKQSYLFEWWLIFWDVFNSKSNRDGSALSQHYYHILLMQRQFEQGFRNVAVNAARQQFLAESNNEFEDESLNVFEFLSMLSPEETGNLSTSQRARKDSNQVPVSSHSPMAGGLQAHLAEQRRFMQMLQQQQQFQNPIPKKVAPTQHSPYPYGNQPPYQYSAPPSLPNSHIPSSVAPQTNMYIPSPDPTPIQHNYPMQMGVPQSNLPHPNYPHPDSSVPSTSSARQYPQYYEPSAARSYSQLSRMNPYTQQQFYDQELRKEQYPQNQRVQLQRAKSSPVVSDKRDSYNGNVSTKPSRSNLVPILENQCGERMNSSTENASNVSRYTAIPKDSNGKTKNSKCRHKLKKSKYTRKQNKKVPPHSNNVLDTQKEPEADARQSENISRRPTTMSQIFGNQGRTSQNSSAKSSVSSLVNLRSNSSVDSDKLNGIVDKVQSVSDPVSPWGYGTNNDHEQQRKGSDNKTARKTVEMVPSKSDRQSLPSVPDGSKFFNDVLFEKKGTSIESVNRDPQLTDVDNPSNHNMEFGLDDNTFKCDETEDLLFLDNLMNEHHNSYNDTDKDMQDHENSHTSDKVTETKESNNSDGKTSRDYQHGDMLDIDPSQFFDHYSNS